MARSKEKNQLAEDAVSAGLVAGGILLRAITERPLLTDIIAPGLVLFGIYRLTRDHLFK